MTGGALQAGTRARRHHQRTPARSEANFAILGPMYSISTDSISMKTNCSDFEDGAEVNDRPVREIRGNSKKKLGKRALAQTKRSLAIEQEGGTVL